MSNQAIAYRNWFADGATLTSPNPADWEASAPLSNATTPQLGQLAIRTSTGQTVIHARMAGDFESPKIGRPVRLIAMLNHNILRISNTSYIQLTLYDSSGDSWNVPSTFVPIYVTPAGGELQPNVYFIVNPVPGIDIDRIVRVDIAISAFVVCGRIDPVTGADIIEPFRFGGLWAGPMFRPKNGFAFGSIQQGVTEPSRGVYSIGGQYYPMPMPRQRTLSGTFALVDDAEVQASSAAATLQDMAVWCGVSRPVICLTDITSPTLLSTQSLYGYFDNPLSWQHANSETKNGQRSHSYIGSFSITGAL